MRRHHFSGNSGEEASLYWLFDKGGTILLGKFGRRLVEFFLFMPKTMLEVGWSLFLIDHAIPGGMVI